MAGESDKNLPERIEDETLDMVVGGAAPLSPKGFKVEIEGLKGKAVPGDGSVKPIAMGGGIPSV